MLNFFRKSEIGFYWRDPNFEKKTNSASITPCSMQLSQSENDKY